MTAYCTYTDVQLEAGTANGTLTTSNITSLITRSDYEITGILLRMGITAPTTGDENLKTASIQLTIAKILRRQSSELSRPNSLNLGDVSFSTNPLAEAKACEEKAQQAILAYAATVNGAGIRVSRVRTGCY